MTRKEAFKQFAGEVVDRDRFFRDIPAALEAFNNYIDRLQKDGEITERQAETWSGLRPHEIRALTGEKRDQAA